MKRIHENKMFKHWVYLAGPSSQTGGSLPETQKKKKKNLQLLTGQNKNIAW